MSATFTVTVEGEIEFQRRYNRVSEKIQDFSDVWPEVRKWFKDRMQRQFYSEGQAGNGQWQALSPKYEEYKAVKYPFSPILRATDRLYKSLAFETGDSIFETDKQSAAMGTSVPYAKYHQTGGGKLPQRKIIDFNDKDRRELQKVIQRPLVRFVRDQGFVQTELFDVG